MKSMDTIFAVWECSCGWDGPVTVPGGVLCGNMWDEELLKELPQIILANCPNCEKYVEITNKITSKS